MTQHTHIFTIMKNPARRTAQKVTPKDPKRSKNDLKCAFVGGPGLADCAKRFQSARPLCLQRGAWGVLRSEAQFKLRFFEQLSLTSSSYFSRIPFIDPIPRTSRSAQPDITPRFSATFINPRLRIDIALSTVLSHDP